MRDVRDVRAGDQAPRRRFGKVARRGPSRSMIVAVAALAVALAGTAVADPFASRSALSKKEKKQARNIAKQEIASATPGIVASVPGTSSGFEEDPSDIPLSGSYMSVASATITTQEAGRILLTGTADLIGADADEIGSCGLRIVNAESGAEYSASPDDIGANNHFVIAINWAVSKPAGTYTGSLDCKESSGQVEKAHAAISLIGVGG